MYVHTPSPTENCAACMRLDCCTIVLIGLISACPLRGTLADGKRPLFEHQIQPVLKRKCGRCHSSSVQRGELDLSTLSALRRGGESGEDLVAESLEDSLLWLMIAGGDMPPEGQPQLDAEERTLIRRWILGGAQSVSSEPAGQRQVNQHDVLPIVLLRCATCHGARLRQGGLDMRTVASMKAGGAGGPALVPGDPDASLLIQRIESAACPPREQLLKYFVRRPPSAEVRILRNWIAAGAEEAEIAPDVAGLAPDPLVTDEERQHWSFQAPHANPEVTSIDELVIRRLQGRGLGLSPEAGREILIRRAYLDLTGMPPGLEEWTRWSGHQGAEWYREMVDHLLQSTAYGERWGRHWLDVAGYADSEGGVSADPIRQVAWKYRDYVIDAFNSDTPYDRFLVEQIAGDELLDHERADVVTEEMVHNLIATGFLRMGIDQTGSRTMNFVPERLGVIDDAIRVLGSGVMGLTMECARCHSHKYDPLPHRDYYRFKAIFQGAFDEHDWLTFRNRTLSVDVPERRKRVAAVNPPLLKRIRSLEASRKQAVSAVQLALLGHHYPAQSEADRNETLRALKIADNNRTQPQRILVEKLQEAEVLPDSKQPAAVHRARARVQAIEQEIRQVRRKLEPPLTIRALWDRGEPSPTYILRRGDHLKPVGPGVPSVLTDGRTPLNVEPPFPDGTPRTGRRLAFARWLTRPRHPLTARVMVNRVWYHHFGTGLVRSLENFGVKGDPPSHPELLDWLAVQFVEQGWSIKQLHRLIMNSRTYRQSSLITARKLRLDPQNRYLSRMPLRRLDAEALRDSLLSVSGQLDRTTGGPPDAVAVSRAGLVSAEPTATGKWRRSVYLQYRRTEIPSMMATFDYPEMGPNCVSRNVSTVSPQSLMLMNSQHVRELAAAFAGRVRKQLADSSGRDGGSQVDLVYRLALSRSPSTVERGIGIDALLQLRDGWPDRPETALEVFCHTILNSAAFLYVD